MAFNGSGTFVRLYNWVNDKAASIKVRADRMDNEMDGFATGLSTCITKDGQTTLTANIPFSGRKITGYGSSSTPNSRTDVPSLGQAQDGTLNWVDGGGTADAITAAYSPAITALVDGQICNVRATAANATTTPTFSPNGLTARTIVKNGGQALVAGDIYGDGHQLILRYDLTNTRWELLNPSVVPAAVTASSSTTFTNKTLNQASNSLIFNQCKRCATQFDKTSSTTFGDVTDLSVTLSAGTYSFRVSATTLVPSGVGGKFTFAFGGTSTSYNARSIIFNSGSAVGGTTSTTLGANLGLGTTNAVDQFYATGTIVVTVSGAFSFQFAQNTSSGSTASVLVGTTLEIIQLA